MESYNIYSFRSVYVCLTFYSWHSPMLPHIVVDYLVMRPLWKRRKNWDCGAVLFAVLNLCSTKVFHRVFIHFGTFASFLVLIYYKEHSYDYLGAVNAWVETALDHGVCTFRTKYFIRIKAQFQSHSHFIMQLLLNYISIFSQDSRWCEPPKSSD